MSHCLRLITILNKPYLVSDRVPSQESGWSQKWNDKTLPWVNGLSEWEPCIGNHIWSLAIMRASMKAAGDPISYRSLIVLKKRWLWQESLPVSVSRCQTNQVLPWSTQEVQIYLAGIGCRKRWSANRNKRGHGKCHQKAPGYTCCFWAGNTYI